MLDTEQYQECGRYLINVLKVHNQRITVARTDLCLEVASNATHLL